MKITSNTSLQDLFDIAVQTLPELKSGEIFIVRDLFRTFEWNRIPKGNRTKLGSMFFSYSKNHGASFIEPLDKTPQNQQKYRKL